MRVRGECLIASNPGVAAECKKAGCRCLERTRLSTDGSKVCTLLRGVVPLLIAVRVRIAVILAVLVRVSIHFA